ncbi:MAG: hypothetical protein RLZZ340_772, partial [Actinomycetota bacterium]
FRSEFFGNTKPGAIAVLSGVIQKALSLHCQKI